MLNKQLIVDTIIFEPLKEKLIESSTPGSPLLVEGIIQRANTKNHNGRVYPKEILEAECKRYIDTRISEKRAFGELDHPDSDSIELKNACWTIEKLYWKGDDLYGVIEILPTPSGKIVEAIVRAGKTIGISSRGLGSVKMNEGASEVQEDFEILCWDACSDPSTHGAFVYPKKQRNNESRQLNESTQHRTINKYQRVHTLIRDIICSNGNCKLR